MDRLKALTKDWENIGIAIAGAVEVAYESGALEQFPDAPRWMVILFIAAAVLRKRWSKTDASPPTE